MTPKITKQKKILLRDPKTEETSMNLSKFAIASERVPTVSYNLLDINN